MCMTQRGRLIVVPGLHTHRHRAVMGFSLVEVIIVSVVLTVLLATVWSLFVMQQRTLERGQRLSRNTRVVLSLQRQLHGDLARVVLRRAETAIAETGASGRASSSLSDSSVALVGSSQIRSTTDAAAEAGPVEFRFAGGSDWLIIDVLRPAYQWGAFDAAGPDPLADSLAEFGGAEPLFGNSGNIGGLAGEDDPDQLPQRPPTPFQRIVYLWLTDEEIAEVANLRFGHDFPANGNSGVGNTGVGSASDATPVSGGLETGAMGSGMRDRATAEGGLQASDGGSTSLTGGAGAGGNGGRRTLVRVAMDWSWPRESDLAGETWENALSDAESTTGEALDFGAGLPGSSGSTTPQRRQWLRRLLAPASDPYRDFHLQSGSAMVPGTVAGDTREGDPLTDLTPAEPNAGSSVAEGQGQAEYLLPDRWRPQVDWFPEVVAGKFQYFDGARWQASFSEGDERKLPSAVRFEYSVDARWFPVAVTETMETPVEGANDSARFSALPSASDEVGGEALSPADPSLLSDLNRRPEFPHVVAYTFANQATSRDASLDLDDAAGVGEEAEESTSDPFQAPTVGAGLDGSAGLDGPVSLRSPGGPESPTGTGAATGSAPSSRSLRRGF